MRGFDNRVSVTNSRSADVLAVAGWARKKPATGKADVNAMKCRLFMLVLVFNGVRHAAHTHAAETGGETSAVIANSGRAA